MTFLVDGIEVDIIGYNGENDFQVIAEYIDAHYCNIIVIRLNQEDGATTRPIIHTPLWNSNDNGGDCGGGNGWNESIDVLMNDDKGNKRIIHIGTSTTSIKVIREPAAEFMPLKPLKIYNGTFEDCPNYKFQQDCRPIETKTVLLNYYKTPPSMPPLIDITREEFNKLFNTDVVALPSNIFAIGITNNGDVYRYNDCYGGYNWNYEIELTIQHIVKIAIQNNKRGFYFLICAHDGYMESYYPSIRNIPYIMDEYENIGKVAVKVDDVNVYPILHKGEYILAQSVRKNVKNVIAIPDRYYFCLNRYNLYRSIHGGIPFESKISKIVYAGNDRGSKYNFITRTDIEISQRDYFKSDNVDKTNIYVGYNIDRNDMIHYKYILDIDGNASTWDATAWKLNSGSVIFKTNSDWKQWFYDDYKSWVHYIPIMDDFSDIQEKFIWCEQNPHNCKMIIKNCKKLFQQIYRFQNVMNYTKNIIEIINTPL